MLQIDRMAVDDVGGDPAKIALAIVSQLSDLKAPIPVREIAEAVDIYEIREERLSGLEGGLITSADKSEGAILVNADRDEKRKRYTIAHELGHYLNPWHKANSSEGFRCASRDLAAERFQQGDRAAQMEVEANEFAAALLMPPNLVHEAMRRLSGIDISHILAMSSRFEVSREAMARTYVGALDEPAAVVFSKENIIRYVRKSQYFPSLSVWCGDQLPAASLSRRRSALVGEVSDWFDAAGDVWLSGQKKRKICEQTFAQQNGYRLTLLALTDIEEEQDDDEEIEARWREPKFHR